MALLRACALRCVAWTIIAVNCQHVTVEMRADV